MELSAKRRRHSKYTNANCPSKTAKSEVKTEHGNGSIKCGRYVLRLTKERLQRGTPSSPLVSAPQGANKLHFPAYSAHSSSGENQVELPVRRFGKAPKAQLQFRKCGLRNYEELSFIFNHCKATGTMPFASTQAPPTSDEENEMEAEQRNHGLGTDHSYAPNRASIERILANGHHYLGKRRHDDSGVIEIEDDDPYHPDIAQDLMIKLKAHLKSGQYSAGVAKLSDPIWTTAFIRSPPEFQLDMLQSLCPVNPQPPQFHGQHPPYPYPYPTWLPSQIAAPFPYKFPNANQPTFPPSYPSQNPMGFPNNWGNLQQLPVAGPTRLPFTKLF